MRLPTLIALLTALPLALPLRGQTQVQVPVVGLPVLGDLRPRLPGRVGPGLAQAVADLNGDGLPDLIRATAAGLDLLQQDGAGNFQRLLPIMPLALPPGASVISLCTGRFRTGAPLPDIVVGVTGGDSLLFENGGGGLLLQRLPSPLPQPVGFSGATTQVLIGDLDGFGGDDVVVMHDGAMPQVFLAQSNGSFVEAGASYFPPGYLPQSPVGVLARFNNDALPDLVVVQRGVSIRPVLIESQAGGSGVVNATAFGAVTVGAAASVAVAGDVTFDGIPDLLLGASAVAGGGLRTLANDGSGRFTAVSVLGFPLGGVADVAVGRVDGDTSADLVILQENGAVELALAQGASYPGTVGLLPAGARRALELRDLEFDGDLDLLVLGGTLEDGVLLGDGAGAFLATEDWTIPTGALPSGHVLAVLDVTGEGDPDIVGYTPVGEPVALANDGSARFRQDAALLPSLAPATVLDLQPLAAVTPASRSALAVLGSRPGGGRIGVNILVRQAGTLVDQTTSRWPGLAAALIAMAVGDVSNPANSSPGLDDIVAVDASGQPRLFANLSGTFSETPGAFDGVPITGGVVQLLLARVNLDAMLDLVVLRQQGGPLVYLGQPGGSFGRVPQPIVGSFPARRGLVAEVTGDGIADLLILARQGPQQVFQLAGVGDGTFVDDSAAAPAPLPDGLTSIAAVGGSPTSPAYLVFGSVMEPDVVHAVGGGLVVPQQRALPDRGSRATTAVLVADLDADGDADLVLQRQGSLPRVLLDQTHQLTSLTPVQLGRQWGLRFTAPEDGIAAVFLGALPARAPTVFGLFRLDPSLVLQILALPVPPSGVAEVSIPTLASWPDVELPLQVGFINGAGTRAYLSNLEFWTLTSF